MLFKGESTWRVTHLFLMGMLTTCISLKYQHYQICGLVYSFVVLVMSLVVCMPLPSQGHVLDSYSRIP